MAPAPTTTPSTASTAARWTSSESTSRLERSSWRLERDWTGRKKSVHSPVSATDRGNRPLTGYCNVTITLGNVNDEMPQFSEAVRSTTVRENLAVGSSVLTYTATDSDDDSSLRYSCLRNLTLAYDERGRKIDAAAKGVDRYFDINSTSGIVYVASVLDRETAERIVVTILVEDTKAVQPPQQSATAILTITLSDYNDNAPTFIPSSQYRANVSEGLALDSAILRVEATDADRGQEIRFELASASQDTLGVNSFNIDSSTGVVTLKQKLDFEVKTSFTFLIVAKDNGSPQLSSSATVCSEC
ncbi:hypothetical protein C0Q70_01864 [Pomacea canaliculata]|uniref:Cadherin domain-containing protein n=2 Tax=Pomacea canaliculata TaxID=400727 RepID=A0A2T7Q0N2_POMCA|nr:hypothetical protein C0Q70_01864 [Pomacea canaliculata]